MQKETTAAEFIEPGAFARRALPLLVLAGAAALFAIDPLWAQLTAYVNTLGLCAKLRFGQGLVFAFAAIPLLMVAFSAWRALRIVRSRQSPPPGTLVFGKTRIHRGRRATLDALGWALIALALAAACAFAGPKGMELFAPVFGNVDACR